MIKPIVAGYLGNKKLIDGEKEREKELINNIGEAVKHKILEQHKKAIKSDKAIDKNIDKKVEEVVKFLMTKLMLFKNKVFDEPVDAMIYLIVIALGFAFFENALVVLNNYLNEIAILETIGILVYRFIGANLLHVVSSGIIGFYWAKGIVLKNQKKFVIQGIIIATILHGLFNSILVIFNEFSYVLILIILFIASLFLLKNFETIKQFNVPATLINPSYYKKLKK